MKLLSKLREHGPLEILNKALRRLIKIVESLGVDVSAWRMRRLAHQIGDRPVVYFAPYTVWYTPLTQRPHYIAEQLARKDVVYIFGTVEDWRVVQGLRRMEKNLYLCNREELLKFIPSKRKYLHLYSTDNANGLDYVQKKISDGWKPFYEFIDEFDERVFLAPIKESVRRKHEFLLEDPDTLLVASARKLVEQVPASNRSRTLYVPNGVDPKIFCPQKKPIEYATNPLRSDTTGFKKTVGYYGALASWVDWPLIERMAHTHPDYSFVFIGPDLDSSRKEAKLSAPNLRFLPPVKHTELPRLASGFDYAWIPFLINEITLSTSPLKVFEYLSMELPTISTPLPELVELAQSFPSIEILPNDAASLDTAIKNLEGKKPSHDALRSLYWESHAQRYIDELL